MTATHISRVYRLGEFHSFSAADRQFVYLVPAGAIFESDAAAQAVINRLAEGEASHQELAAVLTVQGIPDPDAQRLLAELYQCRVLTSGDFPPEPLEDAPSDFPLQTLVLNLTN